MTLGSRTRGTLALAVALALSACATTDPDGPGTAASEPATPIQTLAWAEDPLALRAPAQVMRVWIAPWEDNRGDLHAPGYVYTEIEPRRWTLGAPAPEERAALIRPLQIERRSAEPAPPKSRRDPGPARGNTRDADPGLLGS